MFLVHKHSFAFRVKYSGVESICFDVYENRLLTSVYVEYNRARKVWLVYSFVVPPYTVHRINQLHDTIAVVVEMEKALAQYRYATAGNRALELSVQRGYYREKHNRRLKRRGEYKW